MACIAVLLIVAGIGAFLSPKQSEYGCLRIPSGIGLIVYGIALMVFPIR
jgi:hypothetical protein